MSFGDYWVHIFSRKDNMRESVRKVRLEVFLFDIKIENNLQQFVNNKPFQYIFVTPNKVLNG